VNAFSQSNIEKQTAKHRSGNKYTQKYWYLLFNLIVLITKNRLVGEITRGY